MDDWPETEEEGTVREADQEVNEESGGQAASSQMVPQPAEEDREMRLSSRSERYHLRPNPATSQRLRDCACQETLKHRMMCAPARMAP
ncbi:hypothetical protein NDU88_006166 [Pleurodeles waltl]|uniref:Uncharacterized protein n=1 Tax=Pleurodeles waltl TaxID=8319 RepID=A0AAV7WFG7_PLEWA|nr:hypothetical protein NDU88_006166 [Pleurodeles waltl]